MQTSGITKEIERILDRATPKTNRVGGRRSSNEIRPVNSPRIRTEKRAPQDNNLFQFRNDDGPAEAFSMRSIFVSVILGRKGSPDGYCEFAARSFWFGDRIHVSLPPSSARARHRSNLISYIRSSGRIESTSLACIGSTKSGRRAEAAECNFTSLELRACPK